MSFWHKNESKKLNSSEYEYVLKRIAEINQNVEKLSAELKGLQTNYDNLRGQFNRKLSGIKKEEEQTGMEEEKSINNPVILPYNGIFK